MQATQIKSPTITSIDLLKTLALVTMFIDHVGYYFLPDVEILRVIGRMSFPIWLFLIGYANSRDIGPRLVIGCILVQIIGVVAGMDLVPVNILGTIMLVRLTLDRVATKIFSRDDEMIIGVAVLTILTLPTYIICEYGAAAWLVALLGFAARNWVAIQARHGRFVLYTFLLIAMVSIIASQIITFGLSGAHAILAGLLIILSLCICFAFVGKGPILGIEGAPFWVQGFFQLCGRRTLEIYVIHLFVFRLLAAHLGIGEFGWFQGGLSPLD